LQLLHLAAPPLQGFTGASAQQAENTPDEGTSGGLNFKVRHYLQA
jgi:hypothetical protein